MLATSAPGTLQPFERPQAALSEERTLKQTSPLKPASGESRSSSIRKGYWRGHFKTTKEITTSSYTLIQALKLYNNQWDYYYGDNSHCYYIF